MFHKFRRPDLVLFKGAADRQRFLEQLWDWRSLVEILLYASAAMLFMCALRRIPLSVAMPCTAISFAGAALTGHLLYSGPLSLRQCVAIGLISILIGTARI